MALSRSRERRGAISVGRTVAVMGAVVLVAAACSSSHNASTSTSVGSTASTAAGSQATGTPYTIGVISTDSGVGGSSAEVSTTVHDWVNYSNSHGGINGHQVKLMYYDDGDNPANAASDAQSIIDSHALAILDASLVNTAFQKAADAAKIPVISLTGSGASLLYLVDANFFANSTSSLASVYAQLYIAKYAGAKSIAYLYCAEDPACAQVVPIAKIMGKAAGVDVNYSASVSASAPNYTAQCLAAKAAGSQAMFIAASSNSEIERVAANCASQNYNPIQITASGTIPDSALTLPGFSHVIGEVETFPFFLDTTPAMKLFHQVMDSYLSKALRPTLVSAAWTGMELFKAAASNAGDNPTSAAIYTGLYALNGSTLGGLAPNLTFKPGQPSQANCFYLVQAKNGKYNAPKGDTPICVTPPPLVG